jgi:hypothetical protein
MRHWRPIELKTNDRLIRRMAILAAAGAVPKVEHRHFEFVRCAAEQVPQLLGMALREEMEFLKTSQEFRFTLRKELEAEFARGRNELFGPFFLRLMCGIGDQAEDSEYDNDKEDGKNDGHDVEFL